MHTLVHDLLEPLFHLRVHLIVLEELERRTMDDQLDIDVFRTSLSINVLVDERQGVLRHLRVLAVHVVENLDLGFPLGCVQWTLAHRQHK